MSEPRKPGRPSKYDPAYCEAVIEFMGQGYSLTAFAGHLGVSRVTVTTVWPRAHPEFAEAISVAKPSRVLKLETDFLTTEIAAVATSRRWALVNADPDEWQERHRHEHSGPNGGPIQTVDMAALATLSDEELDQLERIRAKLDHANPADIGGDQGGEGPAPEDA